MFKVTLLDIRKILNEYQINEKATAFYELQRYDYTENNTSKEVRLITKVTFDNRSSVVIRFKNESNITKDMIEAQCNFAEMLLNKGIITPHNYSINGKYANVYNIDNYNVIVTVEDFCDSEVKVVDKKIAYMTGELLGKMHNISEQADMHLHTKTMFDPFDKNELFDISVFFENKDKLRLIDTALYDDIANITNSYLKKISIFKSEIRYAVQGDISLCNLYISSKGQLGVFDYNNSGDNILFFDAAMQAFFEATLMDYKDFSSDREQSILSSFLNGYNHIRPFTNKQKEVFPYLYAILTAFEIGKMCYSDGNLKYLIRNNQIDDIRCCMKSIHKSLLDFKEMP